MTTDENQPAGQEISEDETGESADLQEQNSRLSTERDNSTPAPEPEGEDEDTAELEGDTFPRPYVERLRTRSAGYRTEAKALRDRTTELEGSLFTERVRALDVLADPSDLPFDAALLDDPDALRAAVDALVVKSPHYRRRGTATGTGAHDKGTAPAAPVSLLGLMRSGT